VESGVESGSGEMSMPPSSHSQTGFTRARRNSTERKRRREREKKRVFPPLTTAMSTTAHMYIRTYKSNKSGKVSSLLRSIEYFNSRSFDFTWREAVGWLGGRMVPYWLLPYPLSLEERLFTWFIGGGLQAL
jgi:hypothetical protein